MRTIWREWRDGDRRRLRTVAGIFLVNGCGVLAMLAFAVWVNPPAQPLTVAAILAEVVIVTLSAAALWMSR